MRHDSGGNNLAEIIEYMNPADLEYQEWCSVGMALKFEGFPVTVWDQWSRRDSKRYHAGECERKWESFQGAATPVTGGTIVQIAMEHGWVPEYGHELDWDDTISVDRDSLVVVDKDWIEGKEIGEPEGWDPVKELTTYIETLFGPNDFVGYVTKVNERDGQKKPSRGCCDRTAQKLLEALEKCKGKDVGNAVGDYDPEAGAWICFNPLDGKARKDENVTDYRYSLVESDDVELEKQNAIIHELELPVACLVHSGNKSLHAIVKVEAGNYGEYRKRVDYLYKVCEKNGLKVDRNNKNPARLSRMPGVIRNGRKQFLVDTNIGKTSWDEWYEWIESVNDDLPEPEGLADVWDNLPMLDPCLIDGVLRMGHKMLISGASKAGKSFLQIELCIAIAEGRPWLDWKCAQGRVLYVNLELNRASCLHRFKDVYEALGWAPENLRNIDIWNLRGKSVPMDKLAPKLIRRAAKKNYTAVIIDPIYKVITGDENSADQMANFCNQFDKVCTELGCAVIYCHHHSKGSQGNKRSMDRASGSGVFARDPDALLDLIQLEATDALIAQEENKAICATCKDYLDAQRIAWNDDLSQDDLLSSRQMLAYCGSKLDRGRMDELNRQIRGAKERVKRVTAWRIEGTLREFPKFDPVNVWFDYPVHRLDQTGCLGDVQPEDEKPVWQKKKKTPEMRKKEKDASLWMAFEANDMEGTGQVKLSDLSEHMGVSVNTVKKYVDESKEFKRENGMVSKVSKDKSDT